MCRGLDPRRARRVAARARRCVGLAARRRARGGAAALHAGRRALARPRPSRVRPGLYRGYPWRAASRDAVARSPFRRMLNVAPAVLRRRVVAGAPRELTVVAALAGPPVRRARRGARPRHGRAQRRGRSPVRHDRRPASLGRAAPAARAAQPDHARPRSASVMRSGSGATARRSSTAAPSCCSTRSRASSGTARRRPIACSSPRSARRGAAGLARGGGARRARPAGARPRTGPEPRPHPRLPFADWETCAEPLERAGRVIVAGCRDAGAARALGLVPSHNTATALAMARGLAGDDARTGVLLGPPYPGLIVGGSGRDPPATSARRRNPRGSCGGEAAAFGICPAAGGDPAAGFRTCGIPLANKTQSSPR